VGGQVEDSNCSLTPWLPPDAASGLMSCHWRAVCERRVFTTSCAGDAINPLYFSFIMNMTTSAAANAPPPPPHLHPPSSTSPSLPHHRINPTLPPIGRNKADARSRRSRQRTHSDLAAAMPDNITDSVHHKFEMFQRCQIHPDPELHATNVVAIESLAQTEAQPTVPAALAGLQPTSTIQHLPSKHRVNHYMLWDDEKIRNQFLVFFSVYVIWAALDIAFDVLFAIESSRIIHLDLPPLHHFFPATVACLGSSMLLTMYANIPVYHRTVLVSSAQHDEESHGNSRLVWPEFFFTIAYCCRRYLSSLSMIFSCIEKIICFRDVIVFACGSFFNALLDLLAVFPVLLCNIASLLTSASTGNFGLYGWVILNTTEFHFMEWFNNRIVDACEEGLIVNFCDSDASLQGEQGYLTAINAYIMRPIASFFNFKTRRNQAADINISDPQEAGYFERVTTWWGNYEEAEESPALSFFTYVPLLILMITLPLLQIVASLVVALLYFTAMLIQLVLFPVLVPLGFHSGAFVCFCNVVKYSTGAFCIFSDRLTGIQIEKGPADLSQYKADCRGMNCLHALHVSAFQTKTIPWRFKFAFFLVGMVFYPLRGLMLTLTSVTLCSPITFVIASVSYFAVALFSLIVFLFATVVYIICVLFSSLTFLLVVALITAWFAISAIALIGMELLCFMSAMTNPEVGLILFADADERRYKLGAAAGFLEDFPGFILQAYYTHLIGIRGTAGTSRAISVALSSWRMFVLTVKRFIKFKMMARDRRLEPETPSESWAKEQTILSNSHGVVRVIMFNFRSSLFPDLFSAFLRIVIFGTFAGTFGWLLSKNMLTQSGFSTFLDTNFPVPNVCSQHSAAGFKICDINARCLNGVCTCNSGYSGDGQFCTLVRSGKCMPDSCAFPATCVNMPNDTYSCPCPPWSVAPHSGSAFMRSSDRCSCSSSLFPIPCAEKEGCVSKTNLLQWEVAAITIGVCVFVILLFFFHSKFITRDGSQYPRCWKIVFVCLFCASFILSLGLMLGLSERVNTVSYGDCIYATVADSVIDSKNCENSHEGVFLPIPCGWKVAKDSAETRRVIRMHSWGTEMIIAANGEGLGRPFFSSCLSESFRKSRYTDSLGNIMFTEEEKKENLLSRDSRGWVAGRMPYSSSTYINLRSYHVQILIVKNLTQLYPPPYKNESLSSPPPPPPPLPPPPVSSIVLFDDFSSSSLRSDLWFILLTGGSWGAGLQVGGGNLVMTNRPVIRTIARFTSENFPITISGRFKSSGSDYFSAVTRTDGSLTSHFKEVANGLQFRLEFGNKISIQRNLNDVCSSTAWAFRPSVWYDYRFVDGGNVAHIYIDEVLRLTCSTVDAVLSGNYVAFYNREQAGGPLTLGPISITASFP
jgi:hypothetical protein